MVNIKLKIWIYSVHQSYGEQYFANISTSPANQYLIHDSLVIGIADTWRQFLFKLFKKLSNKYICY